MRARLASATLAGVAGQGVRLPSYPRAVAAPGVVHLGLGAFHRAHQAMVFDSLLQQGDSRWAVFGVAMRSIELAGALAAQDGLYSVQVSEAGSTRWEVIGAIAETCVASLEPDRLAAAIAAPSTRWITLTVTEKGYTPEVVAVILRGLALRQAASLPGLTVASCDNLSGNGDLLGSLCRQAAAPGSFRGWIDSRCAFPNSMVDRIVPAAIERRRDEAEQALGLVDRAALATEGFWEWVLEDRLADPADAAALRSAGVLLVPDVRPFEEAKLRMLNGSHSAMACIGAVTGLPTVADCIRHPDIERFVHGLMTREVMPNLSRPGLAPYRDALLKRFANPALLHSVHQIATDSSMKIPQRWVPCVLAQLRGGGSVEHLAFAAAAWMRYCLGEDEAGERFSLTDSMATELQAIAQRYRHDEMATVEAMLDLPSIWGEELKRQRPWVLQVARWLACIRTRGVMTGLQALARTGAE